MKSMITRHALVLALMAALVACGGKAQFNLAGTVTGLSYSGLVLTNNGTNLPVAANATSFSFPHSIDYGTPYAVTVATQPTHLNCQIGGGTGTAGQLATITITVACNRVPHTLGGTISGLTVEGLVLTNGSLGGTIAPLKDAVAYVFGTSVPYGDSFGVTVLTQPAGLNCSVAHAIGQMGDENITDVNVSCVPL